MAVLTFPGFPQTFHSEDLRARADRLGMEGKAEEAALLHALLDAYVGSILPARRGVATALEEAQEAAKDATREALDAEARAEKAEARLSQIDELAEQALARVQNALGAVVRNAKQEALAHLGEAAGLLVSAGRPPEDE
jgi:hypothetical protein